MKDGAADERLPLRTPDGRYIVVRGRLWRASNPTLPEHRRQSLVQELMDGRRAVKDAKGDTAAMATARKRVNVAKIALGERGPAWWNDDTPDLNRHMVENTPYADWYADQAEQ